MPLEDEFYDLIKKARQGQGLSVDEVVRRAGLPAADITALERGGRAPTRLEAHAIATALGLKPAALAGIAVDGWAPAPTPSEVRGVETVHGDIGGYAVKGYILFDDEAKEAVFIDTGYNAKAGLEFLHSRGLKLIGVCLTHGHADHAGGLDRILDRWRVPVYMGEADLSLLPWRPPQDLLAPAEDGRPIAVGRLTVRCLTTPGHTPGGICYQVARDGRDLCFVGDTLFAGSIGRANPFSLYPVHLQSVRRRVLRLPECTVLFPGHGPATTVREEVTHNPFGGEA
ncbi:MAG: MBL fold metallo-hydrolase [Nitrospirae bacterium]|nr:MBL fold metallo-hydrolase [Nitrospirota bacterium]